MSRKTLNTEVLLKKRCANCRSRPFSSHDSIFAPSLPPLFSSFWGWGGGEWGRRPSKDMWGKAKWDREGGERGLEGAKRERDVDGGTVSGTPARGGKERITRRLRRRKRVATTHFSLIFFKVVGGVESGKNLHKRCLCVSFFHAPTAAQRQPQFVACLKVTTALLLPRFDRQSFPTFTYHFQKK